VRQEQRLRCDIDVVTEHLLESSREACIESVGNDEKENKLMADEKRGPVYGRPVDWDKMTTEQKHEWALSLLRAATEKPADAVTPKMTREPGRAETS
jgi:hypothetical protein